tara:strand:+ start:6223 stop:7278 length:1056 start_codon:yes stop_codon:yes gene_type:complete
LSLVIKKISISYNQKLPFVCFKKPKSFQLKGYFGKDSSLLYSKSFEEEGFLFAPFNNKSSAVVFLKKTSEIIEETFKHKSIPFLKNNYEIQSSDKESHIELIKSGISAIHNNLFTKVVLSRREIINTEVVEVLEIFERLLHKYPNAYVYIWFHPKIGLWMGATPENLVKLKNGEFHTTALASTKNYEGDINPTWGDKEKKEHQYVVDYIVSQIQDQQNGIILEKFTISDTYTIKAGNLLHLKADIKGKIDVFDLNKLLNTLHPTPAVCGLPKESAKSFIIANENYDRTYYTGFLGEININLETELYVNLRCMEVKGSNIFIYVGGGITLESDPEKEWLETINKTTTIKNIL